MSVYKIISIVIFQATGNRNSQNEQKNHKNIKQDVRLTHM